MKLLSIFVLFLTVGCATKQQTVISALSDDQKVSESVNRIKIGSESTKDLFDEVSTKAKAGL